MRKAGFLFCFRSSPGGPRRCKAAFGRMPRALQLPALGRLHSAQDGAKQPFGRMPRGAAVAGFGPYFPQGKCPQLQSAFRLSPESFLVFNSWQTQAVGPGRGATRLARDRPGVAGLAPGSPGKPMSAFPSPVPPQPRRPGGSCRCVASVGNARRPAVTEEGVRGPSSGTALGRRGQARRRGRLGGRTASGRGL